MHEPVQPGLSLFVHITTAHHNCHTCQMQASLTGGVQGHNQGTKLPHRKLDCVVYRASQKRICREYLIRAQAELAQEMDTMRQLMQRSAR